MKRAILAALAVMFLAGCNEKATDPLWCSGSTAKPGPHVVFTWRDPDTGLALPGGGQGFVVNIGTATAHNVRVKTVGLPSCANGIGMMTTSDPPDLAPGQYGKVETLMGIGDECVGCSDVIWQ